MSHSIFIDNSAIKAFKILSALKILEEEGIRISQNNLNDAIIKSKNYSSNSDRSIMQKNKGVKKK